MKTKITTLLVAATVILASCNDKKEAYDSTPANTKDSIDAMHHNSHDHEGHGHSHNDKHVETEAPVTVTVSGKVADITTGKDGYTAKIKDDSGKEYFVTISRVNMGDKYREVKAGETMTVKGESFKMDDGLHIKAEKFE